MTTSRTRHLLTGGSTHQGRRDRNEDAHLVDGTLLAVADGVGSSPRGDLASQTAVEALARSIVPPTIDDVSDATVVAADLDEAVGLADEAVTALSQRWGELNGSATTMCVLIVFADEAGRCRGVVGNVGDSRCYLIRPESGTRQITQDQTLARDLKSAGVDSQLDRAYHIVTSVLGGPPAAQANVEYYEVTVQVGDTLLLCTDGISDVLAPARISELHDRFSPEDPQRLAQAIVRAAWDADAGDNLTAVVAHLTEQ